MATKLGRRALDCVARIRTFVNILQIYTKLVKEPLSYKIYIYIYNKLIM